MAFYRETGEVRSIAGMDPKRLDQVRQLQEFLHGADSWSIVIIRHGYLMREFYTFNVLVPTRFDIWSGRNHSPGRRGVSSSMTAARIDFHLVNKSIWTV